WRSAVQQRPIALAGTSTETRVRTGLPTEKQGLRPLRSGEAGRWSAVSLSTPPCPRLLCRQQPARRGEIPQLSLNFKLEKPQEKLRFLHWAPQSEAPARLMRTHLERVAGGRSLARA